MGIAVDLAVKIVAEIAMASAMDRHGSSWKFVAVCGSPWPVRGSPWPIRGSPWNAVERPVERCGFPWALPRRSTKTSNNLHTSNQNERRRVSK